MVIQISCPDIEPHLLVDEKNINGDIMSCSVSCLDWVIDDFPDISRYGRLLSYIYGPSVYDIMPLVPEKWYIPLSGNSPGRILS